MNITEEDGCRTIISYLSDEEIFSLLDTVTKKQIKAKTKEEAVDAIISYADSAEQFLQRQKIKREMLFKYLQTEKVYASPSSNKKSLIGIVMKTWGKKDSEFMELDDDYDETDDIPLSKLAGKSRLSTKSTETTATNDKSKPEERASQPPVSNTTSVIQKGQAEVSQHVSAPVQPGPGPSPVNLSAQGGTQDGSAVSQQSPQINVHVHINQFPNTPTSMGEQPFPRSSGDNTLRDVQRASSDLQTLGEKFAKWFYDNLNSFNPSCVLKSKDFGPQHFWDDVHLEIEFYSPLLHREALDGPILASQRLLAFPKEDNVLFNPNISGEGVFVKSNPHGLVKILACGSLHRGNACLGIFQQAFGIIRDPRFENNWKIKYTKMQMRTGEVTSLPKLEGDVESQVNALVPL